MRLERKREILTRWETPSLLTVRLYLRCEQIQFQSTKTDEGDAHVLYTLPKRLKTWERDLKLTRLVFGAYTEPTDETCCILRQSG